LHKISPKDSSQITILTVLEDLVVEEVMSKPTALLPEQSQQKRRADMHSQTIREVDHGHSGEPHTHVEGAFVSIVRLGRFEHAHHYQLGTEVSVALFEIQLTLIFVLDRLRDKIADVKLLHHGLGSLCMKGSKDVCHIITSMSENNPTSGVFVPIGNVVDLVLVDNPGILWSDLS
jgi:hypothetical protein